MSCPDHVATLQHAESVDGRAEQPIATLDLASLEILMPLHIVVEEDGKVLQAGRSLRKIRSDRDLVGVDLFDLFEFRRPRNATTLSELLAAEGGRLSLLVREEPFGGFKGVIVPIFRSNRLLLNLAFGFSLVDAVRRFNLTTADFAGTDLAIEMLYLVEAKSAALQESKKLNLRLQGAKVAAEEQAFTDTLTGLKNRRALDHVLARLRMDGISFGLVHLDLDYFKQVNDTYGHAAGDEVLQAVARILVQETREKDIVARVGGDEFIIIFQKLADPKILCEIGERIIRCLEIPISYDEARLQISGSIGITTSETNPFGAVEEILEAADLALYASKRAGRSRATVAPSSVSPGG